MNRVFGSAGALGAPQEILALKADRTHTVNHRYVLFSLNSLTEA